MSRSSGDQSGSNERTEATHSECNADRKSDSESEGKSNDELRKIPKCCADAERWKMLMDFILTRDAQRNIYPKQPDAQFSSTRTMVKTL
jgi:hypothetical protein